MKPTKQVHPNKALKDFILTGLQPVIDYRKEWFKTRFPDNTEKQHDEFDYLFNNELDETSLPSNLTFPIVGNKVIIKTDNYFASVSIPCIVDIYNEVKKEYPEKDVKVKHTAKPYRQTTYSPINEKQYRAIAELHTSLEDILTCDSYTFAIHNAIEARANLQKAIDNEANEKWAAGHVAKMKELIAHFEKDEKAWLAIAKIGERVDWGSLAEWKAECAKRAEENRIREERKAKADTDPFIIEVMETAHRTSLAPIHKSLTNLYIFELFETFQTVTTKNPDIVMQMYMAKDIAEYGRHASVSHYLATAQDSIAQKKQLYAASYLKKDGMKKQMNWGRQSKEHAAKSDIEKDQAIALFVHKHANNIQKYMDMLKASPEALPM